MSEQNQQQQPEAPQNQEQGKQRDVTRRQFLNYTLMGVGGFMVAATITPMLRFAIDPVLAADDDEDMVKVGNIEDFGSEPTRTDFTLTVQDGWAEYDIDQQAYIMIRENDNGEQEVLALSTICTHLGCTVSWEGDADHPNHFFCPCHNGLYDENGVNIPGTPPPEPLHVYEYRIEDNGDLYLGQASPRE